MENKKRHKDRDRAIDEVIIAMSKLDFLVPKTKSTTKRIFSDHLISGYFCTLLYKTLAFWSPDGANEYFTKVILYSGNSQTDFNLYIYIF